MRRLVSAALLVATIAWTSLSATAQNGVREERFSIVAAGERVGHVTARVSASQASIDYAVSNNGRGPALQQEIELDAQGLPLKWRINGRSTFGNPVSEEFSQANGRAVWRSQADEGSSAIQSPLLYVANDDTPWSLGLYARALRAAPGGSMTVMPGGALTLSEVRADGLTGSPGRIATTIYRLTGLNMSPSYLMLDGEGRLAAVLSGGEVTVREGYEAEENRLNALHNELEEQRYRDIQRATAHRFDAPVRIENVRIFDPASRRVGGLSVVTVFRDRITAVEPQGASQAASSEFVIDGEGGVLLPGLHDMHSHTSLSSALLDIAAGVTTTRDQGNDNARLRSMIAAIEAGDLAGPRVVANGFLEGRSEYSARNGIIADNLEEALAAVRWYSTHGYFQVKIYNSVHPEWVEPIVREAHRLGMGVTGHVPAFVTPDQAIQWGYNDIAHVNQLMLGWLLRPDEDTRTPLRLTGMARAADLDPRSRPVRRTVDLMVSHHTALDTTAVTLELLMLSRAGQTPPTHAYNIDHMPIGYQRYRRRSFVTIDSPAADRQYQEAFRRVLDTLSLLHRRGVQLLPGTDDGTGFTLHRELELYVAAGIPAGDALALSTLPADKYLRRDQQSGSIERGKFADFFLIREDPTRNISAIRENRMTMRGGVAYFPSEIYDRVGVRPFVPPVAIRAPLAPDPIMGDGGGGGFFAHDHHDHED